MKWFLIETLELIDYILTRFEEKVLKINEFVL
jgi:hypothetical protein